MAKKITQERLDQVEKKINQQPALVMPPDDLPIIYFQETSDSPMFYWPDSLPPPRKKEDLLELTPEMEQKLRDWQEKTGRHIFCLQSLPF